MHKPGIYMTFLSYCYFYNLCFLQEKPKGVSHLIEVANPNRTGAKSARKVTELGDKPESSNLSRRER